eukprot:5590274-Pleurochrysis_carterae.AAC.1
MASNAVSNAGDRLPACILQQRIEVLVPRVWLVPEAHNCKANQSCNSRSKVVSQISIKSAKGEQAAHTSIGAFRDEKLPSGVDADEVLVDVVLEERGPVVDVLNDGVGRRDGDRLLEHRHELCRVEHNVARPPVLAHDRKQRVDVLVGVPDHHHRQVDLPHPALFDHPDKEGENPAAFVV